MADYFTLETSVQNSRPVEIYSFRQGGGAFLNYTSAEQPIVVGGTTYTPVPIKRTTPQKAKEISQTRLEITMPSDDVLLDPFRSILSAVRLDVTISRVQLFEGSPAGPSTVYVVFKGYVASVVFNDEEASLELHPFNERFRREMPRYTYQSLCNHELYDARCKVVEGFFDYSGLVSGVNGNLITVNGASGAGATAFVGGFIRTLAGDNWRQILAQDGDTLTLLIPFNTVVIGTTMVLQQGCDHSLSTCLSKFNNVVNFGGFPYVPEKNPFEQGQFTKEGVFDEGQDENRTVSNKFKVTR